MEDCEGGGNDEELSGKGGFSGINTNNNLKHMKVCFIVEGEGKITFLISNNPTQTCVLGG